MSDIHPINFRASTAFNSCGAIARWVKVGRIGLRRLGKSRSERRGRAAG